MPVCGVSCFLVHPTYQLRDALEEDLWITDHEVTQSGYVIVIEYGTQIAMNVTEHSGYMLLFYAAIHGQLGTIVEGAHMLLFVMKSKNKVKQ